MLPLAVSRETGTLLYMLARSCRARTIVEFGTSFGISTLHLAAALRDNGGGRLITSEFEPSKVARARDNLTAGGLIDLVEIREGDALQTLKVDLPDTIDLLLLDGAKALYPGESSSLVESRLRPGALIVADDAHYSPGLHGGRALAHEGLHVRALRRGRRAVDEDSADADGASGYDCLRPRIFPVSAWNPPCGEAGREPRRRRAWAGPATPPSWPCSARP